MIPIIESWAELVVPVFLIAGALFAMERRLARVETKVEMLMDYIVPPDYGKKGKDR